MKKSMVALITGGAGSLGLATAKKLFAEGWNVTVMDLPIASSTVSKKLDENVKFIPGDVTSEKDVENALLEIKNSFGGLDVVVSCAGVTRANQIYNFNKERSATLEDFLELLKVNVGGTFNVIRLAANVMHHNKPDEDGLRGLIINTSGFYAFDGQIGQTGLAAAGGAIASMTLPLCRDLAPLGIRVMTIAPGIFRTNLTSFINEKINQHLQLFTPSPKRLGNTEEYAHLVKTIIDNKFLNGETIRIDGGLRLYLN